MSSLLTFDANNSEDYTIDKIINIIDEDDCGPTSCWITSKTTSGSNTACSSTETTGPTSFYSGSAYDNVIMTGTAGVPVDFVMKVRLDAEIGWGPSSFCVICDSTKQATRVTYGDIVI
jgi:hypothetical protein